MPLTITTWNVQNFARSQANYQQKLEHLRDVITDLGSDVVALQEILDTDALKDLAGQLDFASMAAPPDGRGNRVAFLTRRAPAAVEAISKWWLHSGGAVHQYNNAGDIVVLQEFGRPALHITYEHQGSRIGFITAHFKSKLLTYPGGGFSTTDETLRSRTANFALQRRAAEAATLREQATNLLGDPAAAVVVLGDLNDGPEAATTQILYGPPGSQPRGPGDRTNPNCAFQAEDQNDRARLFNVVKLARPETVWSRRHNGVGELLDHILVSATMLTPITNRLRRLPDIEIRNGATPNMIGVHPRDEAVEPDHAAVTVRFA